MIASQYNLTTPDLYLQLNGIGVGGPQQSSTDNNPIFTFSNLNRNLMVFTSNFAGVISSIYDINRTHNYDSCGYSNYNYSINFPNSFTTFQWVFSSQGQNDIHLNGQNINVNLPAGNWDVSYLIDSGLNCEFGGDTLVNVNPQSLIATAQDSIMH